MPDTLRELVIFIASPGDLDEERSAIKEIAAELSETISRDHPLRLRVITSENARRDAGRPQGMINPLISECDVFIGMLYRRWGTQTGEYTSGFEEEFETARKLRMDGDRPQILLWFKRLSQDELDDAGEKLQKVLHFKEMLEVEHAAYLKTFTGLEEFRKQFRRELLSIILLELKKEKEAAVAELSPEGSMSSDGDSTRLPEPAGQPLDEAQEQIGAALQGYLDLVRHGETRSEYYPDRLLLFALSVNVDQETLPTHAANRLYSVRTGLELSRIEFRLWSRTFFEETWVGRSDPAKRTVPFWYFLSAGQGWSVAGIASELLDCIFKESVNVACGALEILRRIMVKPNELWGKTSVPRHNDGNSQIAIRPNNQIVEKWEALLNGGGRQDAAIAYVAGLATSEDLPLLNTLIAKIIDPTVVRELQAIRDYLSGEYASLIDLAASSYGSIDGWQARLIRHHLPLMSSEHLGKLIVGRHGDGDIRKHAFHALAQRQELSLVVIQHLLSLSDDPLRMEALRYALNHLQASERVVVAEALAGQVKDKASGRFREIILALSSHVDELEEKVRSGDGDIVAWEALCLFSRQEHAEFVRSVYDSDGDVFDGYLHRLDISDQPDLVDYIRARARSAALEFLANLPASERQEGDGDRARHEVLKDHLLTRENALYALAVLGAGRDVSTLLATRPRNFIMDPRLLPSIIELGGISAAMKVVVAERESEAELAAHWLAENLDVSRDELMPLLYSIHPRVRMIILRCLQKRMSYEDLEELMKNYRNRSEGYYYNVVVELDRLLYSPDGRSPHSPKASLELL